MSMDRGTLTRLSMQRLSKRFSRNKEYNKVDDVNDTRVPLHNEDAFQHGLRFKAKFIGSLEIARPQSKIDIITAMRRIRYEYKVKGVKKQRCELQISTKGVKVSKRKRGKRRDYSEDELLMMQHPIYRIFYVSHDSQDLKIFSYITREPSDNTFQCNVFKAYKKRLALHIVRSLGQAFDVCHKQNPRPKKKKSSKNTEEKEQKETEQGDENTKPDESSPKDDGTTNVGEASEGVNSAQDTSDEPKTLANGTPPLINFDPFAPLAPLPAELQVTNVKVPPPQPSYPSRPRPKPTAAQTTVRENPLTASNDSISRGGATMGGAVGDSTMSPSVSLGEPLTEVDGELGTAVRSEQPDKWDIERQQINAQMTLMKEQLQAETASRIEAQARVEHLLLQNKELLSHLQKLMVQLQQLQSFQMAQQQKASTPPTTVPDSAQTPPTTEPEDTSSEVTEQRPDNASSHDQTNLSESSPNSSHDQTSSAALDNNRDDFTSRPSDINFDEAFNVSSEEPKNFDDPFRPLTDEDFPELNQKSHDKETMDAAFTPIETSTADGTT